MKTAIKTRTGRAYKVEGSMKHFLLPNTPKCEALGWKRTMLHVKDFGRSFEICFYYCMPSDDPNPDNWWKVASKCEYCTKHYSTYIDGHEEIIAKLRVKYGTTPDPLY